MLMTKSAGSKQPTLVKPRSTWAVTSKTEPTAPIDPLEQVNTPLWSILGQRHGQTPLKPWRRWVSSGTFAAFSKFHLNTSKSTFMKVVQLVEGHNFRVEWHFKCWAKKGENLVNCQQLLFPETEWHSKFGCQLCKIRWEKHRTAFVKVVGGSEIYNFPIHHFVHFYSSFWRFLRSNRSTVERFWADRTLRHDVVRPATSASGPRPRLPEAPAPSPGRSRTEARWNPSLPHVTPHRRRRMPWTAGLSAVVRSRAYRGTPSVHWVLAGTWVTYKGGRRPPLALNPCPCAIGPPWSTMTAAVEISFSPDSVTRPPLRRHPLAPLELAARP
jgi:hypothetical protein